MNAIDPHKRTHGYLYAAEVAGQTVILDLVADRYFLAQPRPRAEGAVTCTPCAFAADAEAAAWRVRGARWPREGAVLTGAAWAMAYTHRISRILERRPFKDLVDTVRDAPLHRRKFAPSPERLLASFEAVRPLYPRRRVCRLDAPAICLTLRHYGYGVRLVFGARLEPFAAHCWAELDGNVLNEPIEAVASFTPLLIV